MSAPKRRPRRGKPGDLDALKRQLWHAVLTAGDLLDSESAETRLRACHAVSQAAATYRSVLADAETDARLSALEEIAADRRP